MKIVRALRREVAATCRSLRYDLRHASRSAGRTGGRVDPPPAGAGSSETTTVLPVVPAGTGQHPEYDAYAHRPRRFRTAVLIAAVVAGGATGTYYGVAGGLSTLIAQDAAELGELPGSATQPRPGAGDPGTTRSGFGGPAGDARVTRPTLAPVAPPAPPDHAGTPGPATRDPGDSPTPSHRPTPSPEPSPTASATPSPDPTGSPTPTWSPTAPPTSGPEPDPMAPAPVS